MSTIRPATDYQRRAVERAVQLLRDALICAKVANCPKFTAKIRRAIKSGGGAERHVHHRMWRSAKVAPSKPAGAQGDFFQRKSA